MSDPGAAAGPHDRFQCGDEAAGRPLQGDLPVFEIVDVGLAVRDHQHLGVGQLVAQQVAQGFGAPVNADRFGEGARNVEIAQHLAHLANQRRNLNGHPRVFALAAALGGEPLARRPKPTPQGEAGNNRRDGRRRQSQQREEAGKIILRAGTAPLNETEVVEDDQPAQIDAIDGKRERRSQYRPFRQSFDQESRSGYRGHRTSKVLGPSRRAIVQPVVRRTQTKGQQAFVLGDTLEQLIDPAAGLAVGLCHYQAGNGVLD